MKLFLSLIYFIFLLIPATRFYRLKSFIYRIAGFNVDKNARIVSSARLYGNISIGKDTFVGHEVLIATGSEPVVIGDYVDIGPRVVIVNGTHKLTPSAHRIAGSGLSNQIVIGSEIGRAHV